MCPGRVVVSGAPYRHRQRSLLRGVAFSSSWNDLAATGVIWVCVFFAEVCVCVCVCLFNLRKAKPHSALHAAQWRAQNKLQASLNKKRQVRYSLTGFGKARNPPCLDDAHLDSQGAPH